MTTPVLELDSLNCGYGQQLIVNELSIHLREGDIGCLLGPSGCGKTTTLRAIAGFEPISGGSILLDGKALSTAQHRVAPEQRQIGMVFQDYALFPHLSVADNVGFGIHTSPERKRIVDELLALVKLDKLGRRYPHELSGGQQQRVALVRAMAPNPRLLLLDEPFSNLDGELRRRLSAEVRDILKSRGISAMLVTHDQAEAFAVCDQVGVLKDGRLQQWDTPYNLYHEPATPFVASFIGQGYFIRGQMEARDTVATELGVLQGNRAYPMPEGSPVDVLLRPDDLVGDASSALRARVIDRTFQGATILYRMQLQTGTQLEALFPSHADHQPGDEVGLRVAAEHLVVFPAQGSVNLHAQLPLEQVLDTGRSA